MRFFCQEYSNKFFNNRSTTDVSEMFDYNNYSIMKSSGSTSLKPSTSICPSIPCMTHYRRNSVPTALSICFIKRSKHVNNSTKQLDLDQISQYSACSKLTKGKNHLSIKYQ